MAVPTSESRLAGPLSSSVASLCERLQPQVSARTAAGFREVLRRLSQPLQVAVAGRISSGKSTLVNALIGRRIASTGVSECTRLVTRFSYGTVDRVELVFTDGRTKVLPLGPDGTLPAELGVDLDTVSHIEAHLTNAVLKELTVIDTPGLGSLQETSVAATSAVLGGRPLATALGNGNGADPAATDFDELDDVSVNALAGAEAVLYVLTQGIRADDAAALSAFTAATAGREAGPVNAIGLLNKVDTIAADTVEGSGGDIWLAATTMAQRQARALKPRVADVLPIVGLLAESAETGHFGAADADALRTLATIDDTDWQVMLAAPDIFTSWAAPVPAGVRQRLLEKLDLYGIAEAVRVLRAQPELTAGALRRVLLERSGLGAVHDKLNDVFRTRADGIKAAAALASMTALARSSGDPGERQRVHDGIEVLLARPEAHQLRLLEALTLVASGAVHMPDDLAEEVFRVGSHPEVGAALGMPDAAAGELTAYALERAGWWRAFASFGATPAQSRVAHVVHRAYFLAWQQLRAATTEVSGP